MEIAVDSKRLIKVEEIENLNRTAYLIKLKKNNTDFIPGQHILLGLPDSGALREYSIYSGINDDKIEVLIREVEEGQVSTGLRRKDIGDSLIYRHPKGHFTLGKQPDFSKKYLFIATGTGIAPFHSMIRSYPQLDYMVLHGMRSTDDAVHRSHYKSEKYISCSSRDNLGDYNGRVTDYLKENHIEKERVVYLCGNYVMIREVMDILTSRGFDQDKIYTEIYF